MRQIAVKSMDNYMQKTHTSVCKGLAILLILFVHLCAAILPASFARLATPFGGTAVAVFLFLSGYGLNESCKTNHLSHFWSKRIRGVLIPYLAVFVIYVIAMHADLTLSEGLLLLFTVKDRPDYYFWYVGYQFLCYGLFYFAVKLSNRRNVKCCVLLIGALMSFIFLNELRAEQSLSFVLGVAASDYQIVKKALGRGRTFLLMLCVGIGALALKQLPAIRVSHELVLKTVQLLIKLPLATCVIWFSGVVTDMRWLGDCCRFFGKYSYEIYLAHAIGMLALLYCGNLWLGVALFAIITTATVFALAGLKKLLRVKR